MCTPTTWSSCRPPVSPPRPPARPTCQMPVQTRRRRTHPPSLLPGAAQRRHKHREHNEQESSRVRSVAPAERKGTGKTEAQTGEERGAEPQGAAQVSVPDRRSHHRPREPGGSRGAYGEGRHRELQSQNSWGRTPAASPPGCMSLGNDAASPRSRLARETRTTLSQRAVVRVKRDGERREPSLAAPLHPQSVPAPGVKLGTPLPSHQAMGNCFPLFWDQDIFLKTDL